MFLRTVLPLLVAASLPGVVSAQSRAVPPSRVVIDGVVVESDRDLPRRAAPTHDAIPDVVRPSSPMDGALGRTVSNDIGLRPGRILVDVERRRLFYAIDADTVRSYPVAVGRSGAQWRGTAVVGRMAVSPGWRPTARQRAKRRLPSYVAPGRSNPLGVRAIYLFRDGRDTLLRIHGTNDPASIGRAVSSGCFRMRNADVVDLYSRVSVGTVVTAR